MLIACGMCLLLSSRSVLHMPVLPIPWCTACPRPTKGCRATRTMRCAAQHRPYLSFHKLPALVLTFALTLLLPLSLTPNPDPWPWSLRRSSLNSSQRQQCSCFPQPRERHSTGRRILSRPSKSKRVARALLRARRGSSLHPDSPPQGSWRAPLLPWMADS